MICYVGCGLSAFDARPPRRILALLSSEDVEDLPQIRALVAEVLNGAGELFKPVGGENGSAYMSMHLLMLQRVLMHVQCSVLNGVFCVLDGI